MTHKAIIAEDCTKIRELLTKNLHHRDIYRQLNMSHTTYHRRLKVIYAQDSKLEMRNTLHGGKERILAAYDSVSKIAFEMFCSRNGKMNDRIEAAKLYLDAEVIIYHDNIYSGYKYSNSNSKAIKILDNISNSEGVKILDMEPVEDIKPVEDIGDKFDK